jgi:hypothetical protein
LLFASDHNPLDLIERDLIAAPVIEAGSPGRIMGGHLLGDLQPAAVLGGRSRGANENWHSRSIAEYRAGEDLA